jgi:biopolymer transport protein ExbB
MKIESSPRSPRGNSKNFCWTRRDFFYDKQRRQSSPEFFGWLSILFHMKKTLFISLSSVTIAVAVFAQDPSAPPATNPTAPPADVAASPGGVATSPAIPAAPGTITAPEAAAPGTTVAPIVPPVPGTAPTEGAAVTATIAPAAGTSPAVPATVAPEASPAPAAEHAPTSSNFFIRNFKQGGPIMWPILIVSIVSLFVVIDRCVWWLLRWFRRDPKRVEKVFTALETGDVDEASKLSRGSRDPVLRMLWNGLNHQHASLQGALQVAAGIEIKRAGHYLVVMDTLVTLAPLLGLLGTITGLIRSFSLLGSEELAVQAVTGGIAEALIATACGLGIAIFALVPFNYFSSRVSNLEFELQTAATNLEVMLGAKTASETKFASAAQSSAHGSSL